MSEAPVTLPVIKALQDTKPVKLCYGDLHRANAPPPPPEFVPDEFTLQDRAKRAQWKSTMARKAARKALSLALPVRCFNWTPEIQNRLRELVLDNVPRRVIAEMLNREYPQVVKVTKGSVTNQWRKMTGSRTDVCSRRD